MSHSVVAGHPLADLRGRLKRRAKLPGTEPKLTDSDYYHLGLKPSTRDFGR
ncbi:MAG: hypothetical protein AAF558_01575 [Verrucomicrobiota bacterium]